MPAEQMCYQQDFLSLVVLRIDFPAATMGVEERSAFSVKIAERFPHSSVIPLREMMVNFTETGGDLVQRDLGHQWTYRKTVAGSISLVLAQDNMTLTYGPSDYTGFVPFLEEFNFALTAAADAFKIQNFIRIGLRYINEIRLQGRALEWDGVIDKRLVQAVLAPALAGGRMQRSMHQVSEVHDEDQILLNYGLVNPDFPAPLIQRHFVIDIDASRQGLITYNEALECVKRLNYISTQTFESCIDDDLRAIMKVKDE